MFEHGDPLLHERSLYFPKVFVLKADDDYVKSLLPHIYHFFKGHPVIHSLLLSFWQLKGRIEVYHTIT